MDAMTYHLFGVLGFVLSMFTFTISVIAINKASGIAIRTKQTESRWASEIACLGDEIARLDNEVDRLDVVSTGVIKAVNTQTADEVNRLELEIYEHRDQIIKLELADHQSDLRLLGKARELAAIDSMMLDLVGQTIERIEKLETAGGGLEPAPVACCRSDAPKTAK